MTPIATITDTLINGNGSGMYPENIPTMKQINARRRNVTKGNGDPEYSYSFVVVSDGCSTKTSSHLMWKMELKANKPSPPSSKKYYMESEDWYQDRGHGVK